jgi:hypothetical protein
MPTVALKGRIADALGPVSAPYDEEVSVGVAVHGVWLGQPGAFQFEVCELLSRDEPTVASIRAAWRKRRGQRARPLILFWQGDHDVLLTEPTGEPQVAVLTMPAPVALAVIRTALAAPRGGGVAAALALLDRAQGSGGVAGFRNRNLLSTHYVTSGFQRNDAEKWNALASAASVLRKEQGARLLRSLGFAALTPTTLSASFAGKMRVYAMALPDGTPLDKSDAGPGGSPTTRLLLDANAKGAERAVIVSGRLLRIYVADPTKGLDDVATASNYIEIDLDLLEESWSGLLPMLFSSASHEPDGLFDTLVAQSNRYAVALRERFRDRVYSTVVGDLARGLYEARGRRHVDVSLLYAAVLRLLYRLLFVLYAEDRNLLPLANPEYRRVSLTQTLLRLEQRHEQKLPFDPKQTTLWDDLFRIFKAIRSGDIELNVPAYNGGLFEPSLPDYPEAAYLHSVKLPNAVLAPILLALGFDSQDDVRGKVDFGDLGVRHLGTLYEGLLSCALRVAETPLAVNRDGLYVPAGPEDETIVEKGQVYVTSPKGGRKASGSHYTPTFIVRRILQNALEPVLESHLERVSALRVEQQWTALLAFHVVDPAMGSGHFLVDALDIITNRFAKYLADHPRIDAGPIQAARKMITSIGKQYGIESLGETIGDFELLRRIVMRNCVYGVDQNPMAVELAKLSLWLHAFVPGLPLSYLGHNICKGNALVGVVGHEIADKVGEGLFGNVVGQALADALEHARRLAGLNDLSLEEVKKSESAQEALENATAPLKNAFDAYSCRVFARNEELKSRAEQQMGRAHLEFEDGLVQILEAKLEGEQKRQIKHAQAVAAKLDAFHWQLAFPEVFLRETPGFDVILGNPPWDKARYEPQQFWVSRVPGLNALPAGEREGRIEELRATRPIDVKDEDDERARRVLLQDVILDEYKIQGRVGHVELAKAFTERVLSLKSRTGSIGYVLPGNALIVGGWGEIREAIARLDLRIVETRNTAGWMFRDAEFRMPVVLLAILPPHGSGQALVVPEVTSLRELEASDDRPAVAFTSAEIDGLSASFIIPWLNNIAEVSVINKMRVLPSLPSGRGWITGHHEAKWDFRSTGPDHRFASPISTREGTWKILMTRHVAPYQLSYDVPFQQEVRDPVALSRIGKNIAVDHAHAVLGPGHARIVFRHPSRNDDSRTITATYLPTQGYLPCKGYVHEVQTENATQDEVLALLGYLNSFPCDWWARRFVDRHVTAPVINALRLPAWSADDIAAVASDVRVALSADRAVSKSLRLPTATDAQRDEARLRIELAVIRGFGFTPEDVQTILAHFSDTERVAPKLVRTALRDLPTLAEAIASA